MNSIISTLGLDHGGAFLGFLFIASFALIKSVWVIAFVVAAKLMQKESPSHFVSNDDVRAELMKASLLVIVSIVSSAVLSSIFRLIKFES